MSSEGVRIQGKIHDAIADILSKENGSMVTKYVALVEIMEEDGTRQLWTFTNPECRIWDVSGMLAYANDIQHAAILSRAMREREDE